MLLDQLEDRVILRRLVAGQRHQLGHVGALVAHPLDAANAVQQRGRKPQVVEEQGLAPEQ